MMKTLLMLLAVLAIGAQQPDPYRVPDDDNPMDFHRPDGAKCATGGTHPCHCHLRSCTKDANGNLIDWEEGDACQNYCHKDKCTCHMCADVSECPEDGGGVDSRARPW
jgi:hypothetical protein